MNALKHCAIIYLFNLFFKLYRAQKMIKWLKRLIYEDLKIIDKIYKLKIIFPYRLSYLIIYIYM